MRKAKILVAVDETGVALQAKSWLGSLGYEVLPIVRTAESCIQEAAGGGPDLVLIDVSLAGEIDGLAADRMRADLEVPVIYLADRSECDRLHRLGVEPWGYVLKPLDERELHLSVELNLCKERTGRYPWIAEETYLEAIDRASDGIAVVQEGRFKHVNLRLAGILGSSVEDLIDSPLDTLIHPEDRGQAAEGHRRPIYTAKLRCANGVAVTAEVYAGLMTYRGNPADLAVISEGARREQLAKVVHEHLRDVDALRGASENITGDLDPEELLQEVVEQGCTMLGVKGARIYLVDEKLGGFRRALSYGRVEDPTDEPGDAGEAMIEAVFDSGEPMVVEWGGPRERRAAGWEAEHAVRSLIAPLKRGEQVIGALCFDAVTGDKLFEAGDVWLATLFANQATVAIENARLYEEISRRLVSTSLLLDVSGHVTSTLDLDRVLERVMESAIKAIAPAEKGTLHLWDEGEQELVVRASVGFSPATVRAARFASGEGYTGWVFANQEPLIIGNVKTDPRTKPINLPEVQEEKSALCVPLVFGGTAIGTLTLDNVTRFGAFDRAHLDLLRIFASQAAAAIRNARLHEETRRRADRLAAVNRVARAASTSLRLDDVIEAAYEEITATFDVDAFFLALYDEQVGELDFRLLVDEGVRATPVRRALKPGLTTFVVTEGRPLLIRDFEQELDRLPPAEAWGSEKISRSLLAVPMRSGNQVTGVISVQSYRPSAYGAEEQQLLTAIAAQLSLAMENVRLFEAERSQRQLAEALEEAAAAVSSSLNFEEVLDRLLEQVERVVGGDTFSVALLEEGRARMVRCRGYEQTAGTDGAAVPDLPFLESPVIASTAGPAQSVVIPDVWVSDSWTLGEGWGWLRSYVSVPIQVGGTVVGSLGVGSAEPHHFDPDDVRLLESFASHAATAIENAQLYEKLRTHAETLGARVAERTTQLRAQYARLEAILDSTVNGIVVTGRDGELLLANPVARDWLTRSLLPEEASLLQETIRYLGQRADQRPEQILELTGLDLQVRAAGIGEPDSEGASAVVAIHDVSHLKALNRMQSRFVSNVSHELRTPIATIKLLVHLMQKQPHRWQEYLDPLTQEANHQADLVEDILEISRVDAGRLAVKPERMDLAELIDSIAAKHEAQAREKGLTLVCRADKRGPFSLADPQRIIQVVSNLVDNAMRYSPGGGDVVISARRAEAGGREWATIAVSDQGIGIPEDELATVFERFSRGEKPRTMQIAGTGLGLAIVKEIVELHGGRVTVESEVDRGSTFTVWLPLLN